MSGNNNHRNINWATYITSRRAGQIPAPLGHIPPFLRRQNTILADATLATRIALTGTPFARGLGDGPVPIPVPVPAPERGVLMERFASRIEADREAAAQREEQAAGGEPADTPDYLWEFRDVDEDGNSISSRSPTPGPSPPHSPSDSLVFPTFSADGVLSDAEFALLFPELSSLPEHHLDPSDMAEPEDGRRRRHVTNEDVSLFGDIRGLLRTHADADGNPVLLDLACLICIMHYLEVPPPVAPRRPAYLGGDPEFLQVLPCGHVLGGRCYARWDAVNVERNARPHCPICRFVMVHPGCQHRISVQAGVGEREIPLTVPEGGQIADRCSHCDPNKPEGSW
ncbi:hypothetical protein F4818DRAFT_436407 [Hypoxylon cercidicola]|nr:hypothetical protein F4818DRAFT_436407 [Hypoxylon cercidicola]